MELVPWERCTIVQKVRGCSDHCTGVKRLLAPEGKNHAYAILLTRAYHRVQEELDEGIQMYFFHKVVEFKLCLDLQTQEEEEKGNLQKGRGGTSGRVSGTLGAILKTNKQTQNYRTCPK